MRHRVLNDHSIPSTARTYYNDYKGAVDSLSYTVNYDRHLAKTEMWDVVTERFRERIAKGAIINNPMYRVNATSIQEPTVVGYKQVSLSKPNQWYEWKLPLCFPAQSVPGGNLPATIEYLDSVFDNYTHLSEQAITTAWAEVGESEILLLASLKEMPETMKWFHSLYTRAITLLHVFRGKFKKLKKRSRSLKTKAEMKRHANNMADLWMELRYAVRPLVFDALGAYNALLGRDFFDRATTRGYKEDLGTTWAFETRTPMTFGVDAGCSVNRRWLYQARAGVMVKLENFNNLTWQTWGLDKPLESVYDTLPLSFVFDWFFNIGDILASWTRDPGLTPLASWITESFKEVEKVVILDFFRPNHPGHYYDPTPTIETNGIHDFTRELKWRRTNPSRPLLPTLRINVDWAKTLDLGIIGKNLARMIS